MLLLSSLVKRSLSVRSLSSLLASLSQTPRRVRVLQVEEKVVPEVKVVAVDHLDVDVAEDAVVEDVVHVVPVV